MFNIEAYQMLLILSCFCIKTSYYHRLQIHVYVILAVKMPLVVNLKFKSINLTILINNSRKQATVAKSQWHITEYIVINRFELTGSLSSFVKLTSPSAASCSFTCDFFFCLRGGGGESIVHLESRNGQPILLLYGIHQ